MNVSQKEQLSLAVRPGDEAKPPFTEEELLLLGRQYVRIEGIASALRDDAAQEFTIAAWQASSKAGNKENIRAFQIQAGKWAVTNFLRSECRRHKREERFCRRKFNFSEGTEEASAETLEDASIADPLEELILKEEGSRALACLQTLPERERSIVEAVVFDDRSFSAVARKLGFNKSYIRQICHAALEKLRRQMVDSVTLNTTARKKYLGDER